MHQNNHGYSGALKNALDTLQQEWENKPDAIVGYGREGGGARSMEQLRLVLIELKNAADLFLCDHSDGLEFTRRERHSETTKCAFAARWIY